MPPIYSTPEEAMRAALAPSSASTPGASTAMTGSARKPMSAVKMSRTAALLSLKYFSTRYLSMWVEIAHRTGPEKAKTSQDIQRPVTGRENTSEAVPPHPYRYGAREEVVALVQIGPH